MDYEPKKLLILRILEILTEFSDYDHRLKQPEIISLLKAHYGIECERKAVARNLEFLQQAGYDVVIEDGAYLSERKYEPGELRLLIDSVLANRNICKTHTRDLIKKLSSEGGKYFKNYAKHIVNMDDWQKDESQDYFYKIEMLIEAIEKKVKVEFNYSHYGADKKLHCTKDERSVVNPYQLFLKNGFYYVACNFDKYDNMAYCRIDKIQNIELTDMPVKPVKAVRECENGINWSKINSRLPYLYEEKPIKIEFMTTNGEKSIIDYVLDCFGKTADIKETADGNYIFSVVAGPWATGLWLMRFGSDVKALSPQSLVRRMKEEAAKLSAVYE